MPVEAAITAGVQPAQRPQTASTDNIQRKGDDEGQSSPFSPRTDVSIKNSVQDMAGILAKISSNTAEADAAMPKAVQEVVQEVLQNAFSLDETLAQGVGSSALSQRFSMEQLNTFSRMLTQLGVLVDKGEASTDFSDSLQTVLQAFKDAVIAEDGADFQPVLLNKTAFQLLDAKTVEDLPQALQQFLGQMASTAAQPMPSAQAGNNDTLGFLKQLVQYLLPAQPETQTGTGQASQLQRSTGNAASAMTQGSNMDAASMRAENGPLAAGKNIAGNVPQTDAGQAAVGRAMPEAVADKAMTQETMGTLPGTAAQPEASTAPAQAKAAAGMKGNTLLAEEQGAGAGAAKTAGNNVQEEPAAVLPQNIEEQQAMQTGRGQENTGKQAAAASLKENSAWPGQQPATAATQMESTGQQAKAASALETPLQNTPQLMQSLKSLASLLLQDESFTQHDMVLLQNFVNQDQTVMSEKDAKQLQMLLRLVQGNIPAAVNQAASSNDLQELPRLWAFMQLCDMTSVKDMKGHQLKKAGRDIADFVASMKHSMGGTSSFHVDNQEGTMDRSVNFMLPFYFEGQAKSYPAYIHVYDEEHQEASQEKDQKETWLRVCVLTDNIGAVELTCCVYDKQRVNMRVTFSEPEAMQSFREYVPALRDYFQGLKLDLNALKVGMV